LRSRKGVIGAVPGAVGEVISSPLGALGNLVLGPIAEVAVTLVLAGAGMALVVLAISKAASGSQTVRKGAELAGDAAKVAATAAVL
jgi:hypothetical protein